MSRPRPRPTAWNRGFPYYERSAHGEVAARRLRGYAIVVSCRTELTRTGRMGERGNSGLWRERPSGAGRRDLLVPERAAQPGGEDPLRQRLPSGAAPGELQGTRRVHHPAAGAAGAGEPG